MAVFPVTLSGPVMAPTGAAPHAASLEFRMRGVTASGTTVVLPEVTRVPLESGTINVTLRGSDEGIVYDVLYMATLGGVSRSVDIGPIVLDKNENTSLAAILPVPLPAVASSVYTMKRGDTLNLAPRVVDRWQRKIDLTGVNVASSLLGPDGTRRNLTVTKLTATAGLIQIVAAASVTSNWPLGRHEWDVRFRNGTTVDRTITGYVDVLKEITP